ncbi:unnamed protein product [Clonostachys rosea]|uniref:C2H2-type domain-containing protein n=1 Tax=Bionectria ochroleuca TaxID=29856 RepID=A0ABY6UQ63_BIOOC|nr:unnamed protein product [Clonostachys rosea]
MSASIATNTGVANADDSASTITVNTAKPAPNNFPPPKTDKPRPHVCGTCQRSFARLEHLKRHERSHTKEKPFECPQCARCFARRDLLLRHQQKLHQTSTPSSRPRNRRESTSGATPAQSRARKNSVANAAASANVAANTMRPRANTISHVDQNTMQLMANAVAPANRMAPTHNRHPSLAGLPFHGFEHTYSGMAAAMGQRGTLHGLPKLETAQPTLPADFSSGLRTAPPIAALGHDFDFEQLLYGGTMSSTINPNALHYNDSPPSMALDTSSFPSSLTDMSASQPFDDSFDWLTGFENQMSFNTENVVEESSPSAISTTSQSGISDVMLDGSNHKAPAGTSAMWQASLMAPPQMPNPFSLDINGSVFPDLLNGAPLSPQPAPATTSQKTNDPYLSTPSSAMTSLVSGLTAHQTMNHTLGFNVLPDTPSPLSGGNHGAASPVTTITDSTRITIVNALSQCLPFGGRKYSFGSQGRSQSPGVQSVPGQTHNLPSTQDLQRYVRAYVSYFHPHMPFLHLPTLSFDPQSSQNVHTNGVGGSGCLILSMAAIGALYEMNHTQSRELFENSKKLILFYLEERRKADVRKADVRRSTSGIDNSNPMDEGGKHTPVWLVQAMLLNVVYGHNCGDKTASDIASTHCAALVSLARAADLLRPTEPHHSGQDTAMGDNNWKTRTESEEHEEWLQWKTSEERKRTLFTVFVLSSILVTAYNHTPALTNSEIFLDLPCEEEFFSAESSAAFAARGGVAAANRNTLTFHDALGELLRTNERQQHIMNVTGFSPTDNELPKTDIKPSTLGCLLLIYALHNYIWETRQRHHNKTWTNEETEKMYRHIEPALKAWQTAWASNPHHSVELPNPFGMGPLSADAIPLLDLAYVRLFVNLSRSKERFWQRDWDGVAEELARGSEIIQHAVQSPLGSEAMAIEDGDRNQTDGLNGHGMSRREKHLRKAASYAADSLAMSNKLGVTFADLTSRELSLQSAICAFDCAQVLAEWIATLQDRVGQYLGILGQDNMDLTQVPAIVLLEDEDIKLLARANEVITSIEHKVNLDQGVTSEEHRGYATRILRLTAYSLEKSAVWPVFHLMARCLETHAGHTRARAEKSVAQME